MGVRADTERHQTHPRSPSIRRRLMVFLLIPAIALTVAEAAVVYGVAWRYSGGVRDADLVESVRALGSAMVDSRSDGHLSPVVRRLLEFDFSGRSLFAVSSERHGLISGDRLLAGSVTRVSRADPVLHLATLHGVRFRIAAMVIPSPREPGDRLTLSIAETLHGRQRDALQILLLTIPVEAVAMALLVASTWWGVRFGLRALDPPTRRLQHADQALAGHDLAPISGSDIPREILPLTLTIDRLFARVRGLMALQDQFVADAAHQLRTPLAGLSMQVERAIARRRDEPALPELRQVQMLTARLTRTTTQLLALARAQVPAYPAPATAALDLALWLPASVALRVPDALQAGVDLGYVAGAAARTVITADAGLLQELVDNLIDNALIHAGPGGTANVGVTEAVRDGWIGIVVEDSGAGVTDALLPRLGERFFRAPDAPEGGSGLGLAIVRRIAELHGAELRFGHAGLGGLCVEVWFAVQPRDGDWR